VRPQPLFREVGKEAGLGYRWTIPGKRPLNILQTIGNGCAFFDANGDGNLDILLVGPRLALYQGDGKGQFTDVSKDAGLTAFSGHFLGCAVGDFDNDGDSDLYISGWRTGLLLRNEGTEGERGKAKGESPVPNTEHQTPDTNHQPPSFRDVTLEMGLDPQPWGSSCGFADLDNDGWLDLYITNYVTFGPEVEPKLCEFKGIQTGCGPVNYDPEFGVLYHNEGGKKFADVTKRQMKGAHGKALGIAFADFDRSGRVSFVLANDLMPADMFVNQGKGRFKNEGEETGISLDESGETYAGMGVDWGDYDNDGQPDFYISNFRNEIKRLYRNTGYGSFEIDTVQAGVNEPTLPFVGWGCKFFDADNDGWLDLLLANGHVQDNIQRLERTTYRQPTLFLHNQGGSRPIFKNATKSSGLTALPTIVGRGLAVGDYDNDGRVDALVVDSEGRPLLLHNETPLSENSWVGFRLIGALPNNRDAYGAKIRVVSGAQKLSRQCQPGGSYLSSSDPRVHFGLTYGLLDGVTITWPDGTTQSWTDLPPGRYYTVKQGQRPE
jgi:enediyne biosynthesis protein E4